MSFGCLTPGSSLKTMRRAGTWADQTGSGGHELCCPCWPLTPGLVLRVVTVLCSVGQGIEVIGTATAFYHVELKAGANADLGGT